MDFQTAIKESHDVIGDLNADSAAERLEYLLGSVETARGFFVALLTSEQSAADEPPAVLIRALKNLSADGQGILVKNLVMSSATLVAHQRNGDSENASGSERVSRRSSRLIVLANETALWNKLQEMKDAIDGKSTSFEQFFYRMGYDQQQMDAARQAVQLTLKQRG